MCAWTHAPAVLGFPYTPRFLGARCCLLCPFCFVSANYSSNFIGKVVAFMHMYPPKLKSFHARCTVVHDDHTQKKPYVHPMLDVLVSGCTDMALPHSDSCECLLHGRCVDVPTPQDVPHVYICAFCANTPNMRGGRMRYTGRTTAGAGGNGLIMGPPVTSASAAAAAAVASSPLAHKSFRSFR